MRLLSLLLCISLVSCSTFPSYTLTIPAAAAADLTTSKLARDRGLAEGNPLFRNSSFDTMVAWKIGAAFYLMFTCWMLDRMGYQTLSNWMEGATVALWGVALPAWNLNQIRKTYDQSH